MHFVIVLTYMNTDWNQAYTISLKFKGAKYGTWEMHNPNVVPWGLVCHEPKGTFTLFPDQKEIEFYSHMAGDSAGVNTLSFVFYDAPKSKYDKGATGSDGLICSCKNPAGETCDLAWQRWC